jgi:secreted trypsin-like serine protease
MPRLPLCSWLILCRALTLTASMCAIWTASVAGAVAARASRPAADGAHVTIVGGRAAIGASLNSLALVSDEVPGELDSCSGTVIAPTVVLTAGHCAESESGAIYGVSGYTVVTNSLALHDPGSERSSVSRVIVEPQFNRRSGSDDAALLILATPSTAQPIALAGSADVPSRYAVVPAVIAGWGRTSYFRHGVSPVLRWAPTVVQSSAWCNQYASGFVSSAQLCAIDAPNELTAPCAGDSGGPLIVSENGKPLEIGVTRSSAASCSPRGPALFTRVDGLSTWLSSAIESSEARHRRQVQRGALPASHDDLRASSAISLSR